MNQDEIEDVSADATEDATPTARAGERDASPRPAAVRSGEGGSAARRGGGPSSFIAGVRLLFEGLRMLVRTPKLWPLAWVPVSFSFLAVTGTAALIYRNAGAFFDFVTSWMPALEVGAWYTWLWLGPAKFFFSLLGHVLFAAGASVALLLALLIANLLSSPFLDALSQRVERLEAGVAFGDDAGGLRAILADTGRSMANEIQRLLFFIAVWIVIWLGGVLIPGGQLVAPFALVVFTAIFLPLDYAGYSLDRQHVSFARRRAWVRANFGAMAGFGGAALGTTLVPGLNLLLLPTLVVAGTLLALRYPPHADSVG